jgi:Flp pilus assembly protein TadG
MMRLRALAGSARAAAMMEFALVLPFLLLLGLGGVELTRYAVVTLRLSQIAQSVADNAGRYRSALDETDVNEIMIGAKLMGSGIGLGSNGRIILSDLEQRTNVTGTSGQGTKTTDNPNGYRQWIRWQRCAGALNKTSSYGVPLDSSGNAVTNLSSTTNTDHGAVETASIIDGMGPTGGQIAASSGTAVMVVEMFYTYKPLLPIYSWGKTSFHVVQAFDIRQRTDFRVYNANNLSGTRRSDCSLFNASIPT